MSTNNMCEASALQKSMWLTQKMYPDSALYNVGGYCEFMDAIDYNTIKDVLFKIVEEQEMLRCQFVKRDNKLHLLIGEEMTGIIEFCQCPNSNLTDLFEREMNERLMLDKPYKFLVISCDNRTVVFLKMHHMMCDGYSISALFESFKEKIENNKSNSKKVVKYTDYVKSELNYMSTERYIKDEEYWLKRVQQEKGIAFESCRNIFTQESNKIKRKSVLLDYNTYKEVTNSFSDNITVYHYTISLLFVLNRIYSNEDFYIGLPIFNRTGKEKKIIGPFIKVMPFGIEFDDCKTLRQLVELVSTELYSCYRHLKYPMNNLVEKKQMKGSIYNTTFSYQQTLYPSDMNGIKIEEKYLNPSEQQEDITFRLLENIVSNDDVEFCIDYKESLFSENIIDIMLERFKELFFSLYKNMDVAINSIQPMNDNLIAAKLAEYNKTTCEYPSDKCMYDFFEEQAKRIPNKIAVKYNDDFLTYKELEEKTRAIAAYLQANGAHENKLIGVCMERSIEMILAIISIYRSGAAYVPIDPEYPRDRIVYIISDSEADFILSQSKFAELFDMGQKILFLDTDYKQFEEYETSSLKKLSFPENWAYMIYTSGSTGKPKGVINFHNALVNRVVWMQKEMNLTENDIVLQKTPFSFDVSVWEFVWPLMVGATIIMAQPGGHRKPDYLADIINKEGVTTLHFVPSMLKIFVDNVEENLCKSLKCIICSGEELKADLMRDTLSKFECDLYNLYGPTEAAIDVSYWKCYNRDGLKTVPIGKSIDNIQLYVLNKEQQLLPDGISGELYISGIGLALGYYKKDELTNKKFVNNTINKDFFSRMYKTDDLARYNEFKEIEYLGRADFQVKINGLRIELGEIECQLEKIFGIHQAKVIDRNDSNGIKSLVAYLEKEQTGEIPDTKDIKTILRQSLPIYMVPAQYVYMDKLPINQNGKLDRKALPIPNTSNSKREIALPRNEEEEKLLELFKKTLGVFELGIDDDFFEYGGTSLKGIQLVSDYGKIEIDELFKYTTVRDIVEYVSNRNTKEYTCLVPLKESKNAKCSLICVPYGGGVSTIYSDLAEHMSDEYNVYAVNLNGHSYVKEEELASIEKMSMIVVSDILQNIEGNIAIYGHCVGSALAFEIAKKLDYAGRTVTNLFVGGVTPHYANPFKEIFSKYVAEYYYSSDDRTEKFIHKIGGVVGELVPQQKKKIYKWFRHDGKNALEYFKRLKKDDYKVENLVVITGDKDPLTNADESDVKQWSRHANHVRYELIENAEHYFIRNKSEEVADILKSNIAVL